MGLLDRVGRAWNGLITKDSAGVPAQGYLPTLGSTPSVTGLAISQGTSVTVSTVFACAMIVSRDVARCTPGLRKKGTPRTLPPITDHAVAKLFRNPNWVQTWFEFAVQMTVAYRLRGNAYAVILRDGKGDPTALIPVNPDAVMVLEAADGSIFYQVSRLGLFQMAALRNQPLAIPEEDVFHLRGLTFNMLVAMSTIGAAREAIGVAMGLEQQAARLVGNGARPGGVLQTAKLLNAEAAERLRNQWESLRAGIQNVGRTAILEDGLEWKAMQLSSVDQQFMDQRKFSVEEVARFFGTPLYKLGGPLPTGIAMGQLEQAYVNATIMPDLDMWEQKFAKVFGLDDEDLVADFDERRLLRADEATRINNQRLQVMSGLKTQNEARAIEGDPPMEGGDVLLRPVNLAASGSDMTGTAPDGAGRPAAGTLPDPGAANQQQPTGTQ